MSKKPIFCATHPRACSTAFERVFMTCRDTLQCVHEPFGDAWYFGPERLSDRYEDDEKARRETGFADSTYKTILDEIERQHDEGKRLFIKDMIQYWMPLNEKPATLAPSLLTYKRGVGTANGISNGDANGHVNGVNGTTDVEPNNPTIVPEALLRKFHFTFLIRHPRSSVPSYYRCTIPPLDKMTGFYDFRPEEAGYAELRRFFDYACEIGLVGPRLTGKASTNGTAHANGDVNGVVNGEGENEGVEICLVDADDLLDNPYGVIEVYCKSVGIPYSPQMLKWNGDEHHVYAKEVFEKWKGFHEDAIHSTELKPRTHKKAPKSDAELYKEWVEKYGEKGAKVIKKTVEENVQHYEYLKQFALKV